MNKVKSFPSWEGHGGHSDEVECSCFACSEKLLFTGTHFKIYLDSMDISHQKNKAGMDLSENSSKFPLKCFRWAHAS